ncbi:ephrin-A3b [Lates japonicus]|uniref:Ephrin-A3b n=1 Tax=Lates japonicus TaxID=270547 RepID=A0AAD3RCI2_LATJO|nr:ephrin-A3b [Lates japonicus]
MTSLLPPCHNDRTERTVCGGGMEKGESEEVNKWRGNHTFYDTCLRLRVYVCCSTASDVDDEPEPTEPDYTLRPGLKIDDIDEFNPFVPKLEKSVSGSSPSRDRLLLTVTMLLLAVLFIS